MFDFEFLLFEFDAFRRRSLADSIIPVLVDDGSTCLPEGAGEFGGSKLEKKNENHEVGESKDENGSDLAEDGGKEFVVQEVANVAAGHLAGGGGCAIQSLGSGEAGGGETGPEDGCGELEKASAGDEKDSEVEELLRVANLFGKEEKEAAGDEDDGKEVRPESEQKEKDAAEIRSGRANKIGFGLLGGLGVEGEILGIEGEEG